MTPLVLLLAAVSAPPAQVPLRIEVHPPTVELASSRAECQLVVTGHFPGGEVRDLTREATFAAENADLFALRGSVAIPRKDGKSQLVVSALGRSATVPVAVTNQSKPDPVRFRTETQAVLTKQGCSGGSCHGSPHGKGGFSLSLFGYDPAVDEDNIVRGGLGRRIDLFRPADSLLLKKPLMRLPHVGGKKLAPTDAAYRVLVDWIAGGAKTDDAGAPTCTGIRVTPGPARVLTAPHWKQQLRVEASFSDGTRRDVTAIATYDSSFKDAATSDERGLVTGFKRGQAAISVRYLNHLESVHFTIVEEVPGFRWPDAPENNFVDGLVHAKLKQLRVPPSGTCDDATFLRRVSLDLTGLLPSSARTRTFLAETAADKRTKLVDELLASDEFARFWGNRAADLMRITARALPDGRAERFAGFLVDGYRKNEPFDKLVVDILTAAGDGSEVPAANYFLAIPTGEDLTETTAQLFMGSRINCAKCHNHPFENWTQNDYYRISAVFARVKKEGDDVLLTPTGETKHPNSGQVMAPFAATAETDRMADRRAAFASWLTRPGNPFFARVEANRIWAGLFGRGIVDPVDDFRSTNPPANPELLDALAAEFEKSGFDRKHLIRVICASRAYQRSTATTPLNADDESLASHALVRRLSAEQILDAVGSVTGGLKPVAELTQELEKRRTELAEAESKIDADFDKWEAASREKVAGLPWWVGGWKIAGPFGAKDKDPHATEYAPQKPDAVGVSWEKKPTWDTVKELDLPVAAGAYYLSRSFYSKDAGTAEIVLGKDKPTIQMWVDGQLAFDSKAKEYAKLAVGVTWRIPVPVTPGRHSLLVKLTKPAAKAPQKFSLTPPGGKPIAATFPGEIAELLAVPPKERTAEQKSALMAARRDGDGKVRGLRDQIRKIETRADYATQRPVPADNEFLRAFGQPRRESPCSCERTAEPTVEQALQLLNGPVVSARVATASAALAKLSDERLTEELYLSAFARFPTAAESAKVAAYLKKAGDRPEAVRDVVWAALNTREFLLQH